MKVIETKDGDGSDGDAPRNTAVVGDPGVWM